MGSSILLVLFTLMVMLSISYEPLKCNYLEFFLFAFLLVLWF